MANIKNFGLIGVGADLQLGKAGVRVVNDAGVIKFRQPTGLNLVGLATSNVTTDGLVVSGSSTINMGSNTVTNVATGVANTDAVNVLQLTDAITGAITTAGNNTSAIQNELDAVELALGLATNGTLVAFASGSSAFGQSTFKGAIEAIGAALTSEISNRGTAEGTLQSNIDAKVSKAGDTMSGDLAMGGNRITGLVSPLVGDGAATKNYVDGLVSGLSWLPPVSQTVADITALGALGALANGVRVAVISTNKIYTFDAGSAGSGVLLLDGQSYFDQTDETGYVFNGTSIVQFTGTGQISAGSGLSKTGNQLDINFGAGITLLPADSVGINLYSASGLMLTSDGTSDSTSAGSQLSIKLDGTSLSKSATGLRVSATTMSAISDNTTAIGTVAGDLSTLAGRVTTAEGTITNHTGRLEALEGGSTTTALQTEIDAVETAVGLSAAGLFVTFTTSNFINTATSIVTSLTLLDDALKSMDTAYKLADTNMLTAISTAKGEAIADAALDATAKANQALADANAYTDSKFVTDSATTQKAIYASYAVGTTAVGVLKGFVHRIKVYVTTADSTSTAVQVGTSGVNNDLVTTADVDTSDVGLYIIEVNKVYGSNTTLNVYATGTVVGKVIIEYLA